MYRRKNGLYEKQITINGRRVAFYGSTEREVLKKIAEYKGEVKKGRTFSTVAEEWEREHEPEIAYNTWSGYLRPSRPRKTDNQTAANGAPSNFRSRDPPRGCSVQSRVGGHCPQKCTEGNSRASAG